MIEILDPTTFNNWNSLILNFKNYSFFHSVEWSKVLIATYGYTPVYFSLFQNDSMSALIPAMEIQSHLTGKRIVSLPFSDFCEPLFNSIDESETLKNFIFSYCKQYNFRYVEFRVSDTKFPYETEYFRTDLRHILDISVEQSELQKQFSENTKRNIKAAIKEGLIIKESNSLEAIKIFYELQCITRKKHGLPPQPISFFYNIYKFIICKNKGSILFAYYKGKPVAALMFFIIGKRVLYKFGASQNNNLPKGTNHLLMWEAIKIYNQKGYKELDFGRTETNHDGLRRFKLGFGADERIIYSSRFHVKKNSFLPVNSQSTGLYNQVFNKLPLSILKFVGNTIYKHIG